MATAGLYDDSGRWLFHTGLPAKSGVGGGLIAVSPGKFGIGTFAPPLDDAGNSVRGQRAITAISNALGGNPYAVHRPDASEEGQGGESKTTDVAASWRSGACLPWPARARPPSPPTPRPPGAGGPICRAQADPAPNAPGAPITEAQRQHMEQELQQLLSMRGEFDQRIRALEVELPRRLDPADAACHGRCGCRKSRRSRLQQARRRRRSNGEALSPGRASS